MTNEAVNERRSASDVARDHAAVRDLVPGLIALLVTQGSLIWLNPQGVARGWGLAWSLSPLVAALWLSWAQVRSLRRSDEYQRRLQLEAMAIGFGVVVVAALAGGLIEAAGIGDARQSLQITFIAGILAWIAALAAKVLRAR